MDKNLLNWEYDQHQKRKKTRNQRKRSKAQIYLILSIFIWAALIGALLVHTMIQSRAADEVSAPGLVVEEKPIVEVEEEPEDFENEKIEAALVEMGYFRNDIPMDFETQAYLRAACEESGVSFELALAVIRRETDFRNIEGDGGDSIGYMQVQPRWHQERMNRLGVTDLTHPLSNFRVGCDYLSDLMNKYSVKDALTAYNSGKPGESEYADTVMKYWIELRE